MVIAIFLILASPPVHASPTAERLAVSACAAELMTPAKRLPGTSTLHTEKIAPALRPTSPEDYARARAAMQEVAKHYSQTGDPALVEKGIFLGFDEGYPNSIQIIGRNSVASDETIANAIAGNTELEGQAIVRHGRLTIETLKGHKVPLPIKLELAGKELDPDGNIPGVPPGPGGYCEFSRAINRGAKDPERLEFDIQLFGSLFEAEDAYHIPKQTVLGLGLDETLVNYWSTKWGFKVRPGKVETRMIGSDGKPAMGSVIYTDSASLREAVKRNTVEMFNQAIQRRKEDLAGGFYHLALDAIGERKAEILRTGASHVLERGLNPPLLSHDLPDGYALTGGAPGKHRIDFVPAPGPGVPGLGQTTRMAVFLTSVVDGKTFREEGRVDVASYTLGTSLVQIGKVWIRILKITLRAKFPGSPIRAYETTAYLPVYTGGVSADLLSGVQTEWAPAVRFEADVREADAGAYTMSPVSDGRGYLEDLRLFVKDKVLFPEIHSRQTGFNWDEFRRRYPDTASANGKSIPLDKASTGRSIPARFFYPAAYHSKDVTYALWDRLGSLPRGSAYVRGSALFTTLQRAFDAQLDYRPLLSLLGVRGDPDGSVP